MGGKILTGLGAAVVCGGCWLWCGGCLRTPLAQKRQNKRRQMRLQETEVGCGPSMQADAGVRMGDTRLLKYPPGNLKTWDYDTQEAIFRDLSVGVLDRLSRVRLLWNIFDDGSFMGKAILGKLTEVIDHYTQRRGLPSHIPMTSHEEEMADVL